MKFVVLRIGKVKYYERARDNRRNSQSVLLPVKDTDNREAIDRLGTYTKGISKDNPFYKFNKKEKFYGKVFQA
jgi:hypothetical protein